MVVGSVDRKSRMSVCLRSAIVFVLAVVFFFVRFAASFFFFFSRLVSFLLVGAGRRGLVGSRVRTRGERVLVFLVLFVGVCH